MHLKLRKEKGHSELGSGSLPHLDDRCSSEVIRPLRCVCVGVGGGCRVGKSSLLRRVGQGGWRKSAILRFKEGTATPVQRCGAMGIETELWVWQQEQFQGLDG